MSRVDVAVRVEIRYQAIEAFWKKGWRSLLLDRGSCTSQVFLDAVYSSLTSCDIYQSEVEEPFVQLFIE